MVAIMATGNRGRSTVNARTYLQDGHLKLQKSEIGITIRSSRSRKFTK